MKRRLLTFVAVGLLLPTVFASQPDYVLRDLNGETHRISDYHGKWVIVNYWTTRCVQCWREIPELVRFHAQHKDFDAVVWGVNFEQAKTADLRAFVDKHGINYPILGHRQIPELLIDGLWVLPTTVLVDPYGNLVARHIGPATAEHIEEMMSRYRIAGAASSSLRCST